MVCNHLNFRVATQELWCDRPSNWSIPPTRFCAKERCPIFEQEIGKYMSPDYLEK